MSNIEALIFGLYLLINFGRAWVFIKLIKPITVLEAIHVSKFNKSPLQFFSLSERDSWKRIKLDILFVVQMVLWMCRIRTLDSWDDGYRYHVMVKSSLYLRLNIGDFFKNDIVNLFIFLFDKVGFTITTTKKAISMPNI